MKVELIAHTPDPDYVVAMSAKLCYSKVGVSDIKDGLDDEKVEKFISHLTSIGHESPVEKAKSIFIKSMIESQRAYDDIVDALMEDNVKFYLSQGHDEKKSKSMAEKKSIEDARYVFPNACETKIVVTMNARTLLNFFEHRLCERAQWEIKEMAYLMLEEVKKVSPHIFKNSGPSCVSKNKCKEGAMSCRHPEIPKGRIADINEKIKGEL